MSQIESVPGKVAVYHFSEGERKGCDSLDSSCSPSNLTGKAEKVYQLLKRQRRDPEIRYRKGSGMTMYSLFHFDIFATPPKKG